MTAQVLKEVALPSQTLGHTVRAPGVNQRREGSGLWTEDVPVPSTP